ncbi:uncharacterized protein LOC109281587 isoform X2 [Alligator mississippiensis]|nr:uncharacterized protein LOC109281587 isoform X2 [Alligator mississippiensis]
MEQLVLEVTTEMAKHLRQEIFSQKNPNWALSFDVILSATKEERNTKERREKKNDDDRTYFVLQHIKVQDHYSKKEVWKCMLEEHVEDESMKRGGYVDDGFNILASF